MCIECTTAPLMRQESEADNSGMEGATAFEVVRISWIMGLPETVWVLPEESNRGWARMGTDNENMDANPMFQCSTIS